MFAVSAGGAAWLFFAGGGEPGQGVGDVTIRSLLSYLSGVWILWFGLEELLLHVVCPIAVLKKEDRTEALADYGGVYGPREQYWYIRFADDPEIYHVSSIFFRRMRNRVGSVYAYRKKTCPLGVAAIGGVRLVAARQNQPSQWERTTQQPKVKRMRNIAVFVMILALVALLALFGYIFTRQNAARGRKGRCVAIVILS